MATQDKEKDEDESDSSTGNKDASTLRGKFGAAWEDLERRVEAGVHRAASLALAPLLAQVSELRTRVEKLATKLEDVARSRLGKDVKDSKDSKDERK